MASVTRRALCSGGCCLTVVLALSVVASSSVAAEDEGSGPNWHVVSVTALLPSAVCTPAAARAAASNSSALSVVHRHGPCSPLQSRGGGEPSHAEILNRDQDRVDSIHRLTAGPSTASASKGVSLPAHRGVPLGTANYIVSVGLGTPKRDMLVVFDTGSDLSWVQCKPCDDCYQQHDPLFDPSQSSTYSAVPCGAQECQRLDSGSCSPSGKQCRYEVVYGDMSQTDGNLARDTLTLGPSPSDRLQGFVFGCGDDDAGLFGKADGLVGLGRDRVSLASQAAARYGAGFSYCLPSTSSAEGYLSLGTAGAALPRNAQFTAMVTRRDAPSFYYLNLVGIKVAGQTIRVAPAVFKAPGTVIDSGTVVTRLPASAYSALRSSFVRRMRRYRRAPALSILDTCYDFTGLDKVRIPSVALLFDGGATLNLGIGGVLYVANKSQACLAFASNGDDTSIGILGNMQQKTFAVVYDVANQRIGKKIGYGPGRTRHRADANEMATRVQGANRLTRLPEVPIRTITAPWLGSPRRPQLSRSVKKTRPAKIPNAAVLPLVSRWLSPPWRPLALPCPCTPLEQEEILHAAGSPLHGGRSPQQRVPVGGEHSQQ